MHSQNSLKVPFIIFYHSKNLCVTERLWGCLKFFMEPYSQAVFGTFVLLLKNNAFEHAYTVSCGCAYLGGLKFQL